MVLGRAALAQGLIDRDLLLVLNDHPTGAEASYWLCYREARQNDPIVTAFR